MRPRGSVLATILVVCAAVGVVGGLAAAALRPQQVSDVTPMPLPDSERFARYDQELDARWDSTSALLPDVPRPVVDPVVSPSAERWALGLNDCFADRGIVSRITPLGEKSFAIPAGTPDADFAVSEFVCTATFPQPGAFDYYLSGSERSALYDYYVQVRVPCLELHGSVVTGAPGRDAFVSYSGDGVLWIPAPREPAADPVALERACPTKPAWQRDARR